MSQQLSLSAAFSAFAMALLALAAAASMPTDGRSAADTEPFALTSDALKE